eukprot:SAG31_NODE_9825_length_1223_cov_1.159253_1_plen_105_part_10
MADVQINPLADSGRREAFPSVSERSGETDRPLWGNEHVRCVRGGAPAWHSCVVDCSNQAGEGPVYTVEGRFPQFSPDGRWILCANGPGAISVVDAHSRAQVADAR